MPPQPLKPPSANTHSSNIDSEKAGLDARRPAARENLYTFNRWIDKITCPRIAVLGTDCAIGKRTTATIMTRALRESGINAMMIGTGQTGLIQGELEAKIVEAFERESPDVIVVEEQEALSHPAYSTLSSILRGSRPHGVVLQHAPGRTHRCDFERMAMISLASEIILIQAFANTRVIGLTINHENINEAEIGTAIVRYERELGIPVTDALRRPPERLVEMVLSAFPRLGAATVATAR